LRFWGHSGEGDPSGFLRRLRWVLALLLFVAVAEFSIGVVSGSKLLLKDGWEWGYAIALYGVAFFSYGRSALVEKRATLLVAAILLVASLQGAYEIVADFLDPTPDPPLLSMAGSSALAVCVSLATFVLIRPFARSQDPVAVATYLSAAVDLASTLIDVAAAWIIVYVNSRPVEMLADGLGVALGLYAAVAVARRGLRGPAPR
jgi:Co/Zn/Cd efflux system component